MRTMIFHNITGRQAIRTMLFLDITGRQAIRMLTFLNITAKIPMGREFCPMGQDKS